MSTIYLVLACTEYEGSTPIKAFAKEADAEALKQACMEHRDNFPQGPDSIVDTPENDQAWDEWDELHEKWMSSHPMYPETYIGYDSYAVLPLELQS